MRRASSVFAEDGHRLRKCRGTCRQAVRVALVAAAALAPATARADWIIPPGREAVVAQMLGLPSGELPGGFRFQGAEIGRDRIRAVYLRSSDGATVQVVLSHPDEAPPGAVRTERFAIVFTASDRAADLTAIRSLLAARVREVEPQEFWERPGAADGARATSPLDAPRVPWILLLALGTLATQMALRWRRRPVRRRWVPLAGLSALTLLTLLFRAWAIEPAFFHQNGQGAFWIDMALRGGTQYGPGYAELYGFVARLRADAPDHAVFLVQALLGALCPALGWLIARAAGASALFAGSFALALAVDPALGRLASSESHYASSAFLLFAATAALTLGMRRSRGSLVALAWAALPAALLVAEAARVHPTAWVPAALVPLAAAVAPGRPTFRLRRALVATATIAIVTAVLAGPTLARILTGDVGATWLSIAGHGAGVQNALAVLPIAIVALMPIVLVSRQPRRAALRAAIGLVVLGTALASDVLGRSVTPWVHAASERLFVPPLLAALAAVLGGLARRPLHMRSLAAAVAALGLFASCLGWSTLTELPTDAREGRIAQRWRERLPRGAALHYVARAHKRVLFLPVWRRDLVILERTAGPGPIDVRPAGRATYYYRSSLCSTPEARTECESIERSPGIRPIELHVLPAVPSMVGMEYDSPQVRVGLYRIEEARGQ